jgi:hypothetical protein
MLEWWLARGNWGISEKSPDAVNFADHGSHVKSSWIELEAPWWETRSLTAWAMTRPDYDVVNKTALELHRITTSVIFSNRRIYSVIKETRIWYYWYSVYFYVIHSVANILACSYIFCFDTFSAMETINDPVLKSRHLLYRSYANSYFVVLGSK